jgi:hypothetical protein
MTLFCCTNSNDKAAGAEAVGLLLWRGLGLLAGASPKKTVTVGAATKALRRMYVVQ